MVDVGRCVVKYGSALALALAAYWVVVCPCRAIGRCHWKRIMGAILAAVALLFADNALLPPKAGGSASK